MAKYSINLLQPDLLPAKALWTLNRVVGLWGAVLALMLVLILWVQWQVTTASTELQVAQSLNSRQQLQLQNLEAVIAENRTDAALLSQLNVIKLVIANKQH
ncbi:hypothetical protein [Colwellia chukchiensis]|nr:hypothetical protein [Colwellia chukchiensis]